ncbi:hypothetical protein BCV69DRAFT_285663 [Microstroma glucosiphilum]|uniref:Uncharacterized protein n=1 Tax=Pseudomicrostroma glucosiphilum TaxID=1684307 RepID=A0A316U4C2_9BASI|nr:hypothetical protein BCV69DRAFT_285663 [Pseudomicrostroma glucosiphilum]PWN17775.1 hypothetical protein BCV69DRAFT_285663 [Pseudomicrostroma glucosiphilum]
MRDSSDVSGVNVAKEEGDNVVVAVVEGEESGCRRGEDVVSFDNLVVFVGVNARVATVESG